MKFARPAVALTLVASSAAVIPATSAGALTTTPEMVKDIGTGSNGSDDLVNSLGGLSEIFVDGDIAYFAARSTHNGTPDGDGLWKSDGTEQGTIQLASATDLGGSGIDNFLKIGSDIYFTVIEIGGIGTRIKKYNLNTNIVTDAVTRTDVRNVINSGLASDYLIDSMSLWKAGNFVYFVATADGTGSIWDLFRYNGSTVERATTLAVGSNQSIGPVFELNGTTYFQACYDCYGDYTYEFDTIPTSGRVSLRLGSVKYSAGSIAIVEGTTDRAYILGNALNGGAAIITFNGSSASVVTDGSTDIRYTGTPTVVGSRVYFSGEDNTPEIPDPNRNGQFLDGEALWFVDTSTSPTTATEIKQNQIFNVTGYQTPGMQGSLNDSVYFFYQTFSTNQYKYELWRTDGTAAGTYVLDDSGFTSNFQGSLYAAQGEIYFNTASGMKHSDGTVSGTSTALASPSFFRYFTQGTNVLFFYGQTFENNASLGVELHGVIPAGATPPSNSGSNNNSNTGSNTSGSGGSNTNSTSGTSQSSSVTSTLTDAQIAAFKAAALVQGSQVIAGQSYTVAADGFSASETVNGYLKGSSSSIGSSSANTVGKASVSIKIPSNASGKKTLYLHGARSGHGVRQTITINKAANVLPATGNNPQLMLWAVAVLTTGIGILGATRRRRFL